MCESQHGSASACPSMVKRPETERGENPERRLQGPGDGEATKRPTNPPPSPGLRSALAPNSPSQSQLTTNSQRVGEGLCPVAVQHIYCSNLS